MSDSKQTWNGSVDEDGDDDKNTITLLDASNDRSAKDLPAPSPLLRGMDLDLSFAGADGKQIRTESEDCIGIQEEQVSVVFDLPDGSQGESMFKLGQTVEVLKSYIESEFGIPMMEQELYLGDGDKLLQNPFSLLDYPEAKGAAELFVQVVGNLPQSSRK